MSDVERYGWAHGGHTEDLAFYRLLAEQVGGTVVELGCGTGRLTLPLLEAGRRVVGVDWDPQMLAALKARAPEQALSSGRLRLVEQDVRALDLGEAAPLVIWPYYAVHELPDVASIRAVLRRVRQHLLPTGLLVVDHYLPEGAALAAELEEEEVVVHATARGEAVSRHSMDWDAERSVATLLTRWELPDGGTVEDRTTHLYPSQRTFDRLWAEADLKVVETFQDHQGTPDAPEALHRVVVLAPATP